MKNYKVEYCTIGGKLHTWEGVAENDDDAVLKAHEESYESMSSNDWFKITLAVYII